eukprot:TRINITY_DN1108_c0_g1_i2.p2 TRINITY_DN1108_c0_g1~~TRINITY_DN1108_c0_g1_i2.p2  ORF type:complete len:159 (+),score=31.10 TRINITY_DN1108_c0_g1_i2:91-567(+)
MGYESYAPTNTRKLEDYEDDGVVYSRSSTSRSKVQLGLIRRVYTLLTLQLLIVTSVVCAAYTSISFANFLESSVGFRILSIIVTFASLFALFFYHKQYPVNLALLLVFTLGTSFSIALACIQFDTDLVVMAAFTTLSLFLGLTFYAFTCKEDLRWVSL